MYCLATCWETISKRACVLKKVLNCTHKRETPSSEFPTICLRAAESFAASLVTIIAEPVLCHLDILLLHEMAGPDDIPSTVGCKMGPQVGDRAPTLHVQKIQKKFWAEKASTVVRLTYKKFRYKIQNVQHKMLRVTKIFRVGRFDIKCFEDVVALWRCGSSSEMWWLIGSAPVFSGRSPWFESSISYNDRRCRINVSYC